MSGLIAGLPGTHQSTHPGGGSHCRELGEGAPAAAGLAHEVSRVHADEPHHARILGHCLVPGAAVHAHPHRIVHPASRPWEAGGRLWVQRACWPRAAHGRS